MICGGYVSLRYVGRSTDLGFLPSVALTRDLVARLGRLSDVTVTLDPRVWVQPGRASHRWSIAFSQHICGVFCSVRLPSVGAPMDEPVAIVTEQRPSNAGRCCRSLHHGSPWF